MEVIRVNEKEAWNKIVASFPTADIYYHNEYVKSLLIGNKGVGVLFYFCGDRMRMCFPMIIRDLTDDEQFQNLIAPKEYYDMEVPYGYGGPVCDYYNEQDAITFKRELQEWCKANKIVSQFIRFHPVFGNALTFEPFFDDVKYMHHTVCIDTSDKDLIMSNMDSKNRNMVRKAQKNNVSVEFECTLEHIEDFKRIYKQTMDQHHADEMYYFSDEYYRYLKQEFGIHTLLVCAVYDGKRISASLFFYDEHCMNYHLSGTLYEYRNLAASNLLLYETACWAAEHGIKRLHLGGGITENDSLYGFKKQFNKNGICDFYIGRTVFLPEAYERLMAMRKEHDKNFDANNSRMIQYRG